MVQIIAAIAVLVILFALNRWFVLWYFKIDLAIEHLASIDESLKQLPAVRRHEHETGQRVR